MTERDADAIRDTFERDQDDAAINEMTKQVARHFATMRLGAGMSEDSALILTRDFQRFLMVGEEAGIVFTGMVDD